MASTWLTAGELYRKAAQSGRNEIADRATEEAVLSYRKAVDLYPNDALTTASLARALRMAGKEAEFRRAADRALQLHELTPHKDKKLPLEVLDELRHAPSRSIPQEP